MTENNARRERQRESEQTESERKSWESHSSARCVILFLWKQQVAAYMPRSPWQKKQRERERTGCWAKKQKNFNEMEWKWIFIHKNSMSLSFFPPLLLFGCICFFYVFFYSADSIRLVGEFTVTGDWRLGDWRHLLLPRELSTPRWSNYPLQKKKKNGEKEEASKVDNGKMKQLNMAKI